jgi:pimeloyl-ACP methyl ester carboxylesterase
MAGELRLSAASIRRFLVKMRRAYTQCRFGQLHYVTAGGGTGKPVLVLLHQNPSTILEYRFLIEAMSADRIVIAFDTPGYGMSDPPPEALSIADYAAAFEDGLEALGVGGPIDVYGFHTGTYLSVELALANPARVGRLALTGIPCRTPAERAERLASARATPPPTEDGAEIIDRLRGLWDFCVTQRHPGIPIRRAAELFADRAKPLDRYWWAYNGVWSYDPETRLPLVTQPVLLAQPNEAITPQSLEAIGMFPNATVTMLPNLTRDIFEPEAGLGELVRALRAFLV